MANEETLVLKGMATKSPLKIRKGNCQSCANILVDNPIGAINTINGMGKINTLNYGEDIVAVVELESEAKAYSGAGGVGDSGVDGITRLDNSGIFSFTEFGSSGSGNGQFNNPRSMCIYNSEIYVIDYLNYRIQVFDLKGNYQRQWGSQGTGNSQFTFWSGFGGICEIGGKIYVADSRTTPTKSRIQRFDPDGTYESQFDLDYVGGYITAIASWGSLIYGAVNTSSSHVRVWNTSGTLQDQWGYAGSSPDSIVSPRGIAVDGTYVYVSDDTWDRITKWDLVGNYQTNWGSTGTGNGQYNLANQLKIYNSELYITDPTNARITVTGLTGVYARKWTPSGSDPWGIEIDASGNVFVSDYTDDKVYVTDTNGDT